MTSDISFWISLILTLAIFSYLLADNFLYRIAVSIFVGLAAAFTTIVTVQSIILPLLVGENSNLLVVGIAAVLAALLLLKPIRSLRPFSNLALGFLIAVGTAAAVVGTISGTIIPLISQTAQLNTQDGLWALISSFILVLGVITSLLYFSYGARRNENGEIERGRVMKVIATIGQGFIVVTLGALYGAAILTSLTILTGQLELLLGT